MKDRREEKALQIGIPDDDPFEGQEPTEPGWELPIASRFTQPGMTLPYEYDFGDGWKHSVTLEAIVARQDGQKYPLRRRHAARPRIAAARPATTISSPRSATPDHEEHESVLEWPAERFDPERFDPSRGEVRRSAQAMEADLRARRQRGRVGAAPLAVEGGDDR